MLAIAQKKSTKNHKQQKNDARYTTAGQQVSIHSFYGKNNILIQRKSSCSCDGGCPRCLPVQAKLKIGQPDDPYEREADRVADEVMRMSNSACVECEGEEYSIRQRRKKDRISTQIQMKAYEDIKKIELEEDSIWQKYQPNQKCGVTPDLQSRIQDLRGGGQPLPQESRLFFESQFGYYFSRVRLHTGSKADETAVLLNAKAFTLGQDIIFQAHEYSPNSRNGQWLLAHELSHVIQQGGDSGHRSNNQTGPIRKTGITDQCFKNSIQSVRIREKESPDTLRGEWRILSRPTNNPLVPGGQTDEQLLEAAFREICPLCRRSGNIIRIPMNVAPPSSRRAGCRCLQDIERILPGMKSSRPPAEIQVEPFGWSRCSPGSDPVFVSARHPDDPFSWGYWTTTTPSRPTERRHVKPFWQTVAHEICGHVLAYVRSGGQISGGRGDNPRLNPRLHDVAIEGENIVAAEHGVPVHEQRGYQFAHGGRPVTRHAGESFLASYIPDFQHGSHTLPASATNVINSIIATLRNFPLFVELEGYAYANEGGLRLAQQRARAVQAELVTRGINRRFRTRTGTVANRFIIRGSLASGTSAPATSQWGKIVRVYLFHNARSAGP